MEKAKKAKAKLIDTVKKYINSNGYLKKMLRSKLIR